MKGEILSVFVAALTLTGCNFATSEEHTPAPRLQEAAPDILNTRKQSVTETTKEGHAARTAEPPVKLYDEIKRLNKACVQAGGGVSGLPDCDTATLKENELEKLGYCIDYPNKETLIRCSEVVRRP